VVAEASKGLSEVHGTRPQRAFDGFGIWGRWPEAGGEGRRPPGRTAKLPVAEGEPETGFTKRCPSHYRDGGHADSASVLVFPAELNHAVCEHLEFGIDLVRYAEDHVYAQPAEEIAKRTGGRDELDGRPAWGLTGERRLNVSVPSVHEEVRSPSGLQTPEGGEDRRGCVVADRLVCGGGEG
jgi:hypothetical protein